MINTFWKIFQSSSSLSSCQNAQVAQQFRRQFEKCPNTIKLCTATYYKVRCLSLHPHLSCPRLAKRFPVREEAELAESENIVRKSVRLASALRKSICHCPSWRKDLSWTISSIVLDHPSATSHLGNIYYYYIATTSEAKKKTTTTHQAHNIYSRLQIFLLKRQFQVTLQSS